MKTLLIWAPIALKGPAVLWFSPVGSDNRRPSSGFYLLKTSTCVNHPSLPPLPPHPDTLTLTLWEQVQASRTSLSPCSQREGNKLNWGQWSREVRGHLLTFASSLIFQNISSMQADASSLESWPSTGKHMNKWQWLFFCFFTALNTWKASTAEQYRVIL